MNDIISCIEGLRTKLNKHRRDGLNEPSTETIFVEPLLQALGWDVRNTDEVAKRYSTTGRKEVDYAAKIKSEPVLFIEAKALNDPLTDINWITQAVDYATNAGVEWCILTNGVTYKVYRSIEKAKAPDKLLFEISLDPKKTENMSTQQVAERFALFSRDGMAEGRLNKIGEQMFTAKKIKKALGELFTEPPNKLITLIRSTIGDNTIKPKQVKNAFKMSEVEITLTPRQRSPEESERVKGLPGVKKWTIPNRAESKSIQSLLDVIEEMENGVEYPVACKRVAKKYKPDTKNYITTICHRCTGWLGLKGKSDEFKQIVNDPEEREKLKNELLSLK